MNKYKKLIITSFGVAGLLAGAASAEVAPTARELFNLGDVAGASAMVMAELENNPKSKEAGALYLLLGECQLSQGDRDGAQANFEKADARGVADADRLLGHMAMQDYNFGKAATLFAKYLQMKEKAGTAIDPEVYSLKSRAQLAEGYLGRVDQVEIIDSINVSRENFFKQVKLPASAGRLLTGSEVQMTFEEEPAMVFTNEGHDYMLFEQPDTLGRKVLVESIHLLDGSWSPSQPTDSTLHIGDTAYPFMLTDGVTLYFAAAGPQSIGGYDLFVATRDPLDNTYMKPTNLGMPYNSPADDFLMAIDEENGVGWLATDRNSPGGDVTLYLFIPNEMRRNYPADTANISALARLLPWRATQTDSISYDELAERVRALPVQDEKPKEEFRFHMPGGKLITNLNGFSSERARELMPDYLEAAARLAESEEELRELRAQYRDIPEKITGNLIRNIEERLESERAALRKAGNAVIKAENSDY